MLRLRSLAAAFLALHGRGFLALAAATTKGGSQLGASERCGSSGSEQCVAQTQAPSLVQQRRSVSRTAALHLGTEDRDRARGQPIFCTDAGDDLWDHFCKQWQNTIDVVAVPHATEVCCANVPSPCRTPGHTCSTEVNCLVPSCSQEDWYLHTIEPAPDDAWFLFQQNTSAFRECAFSLANTSCGSVDMDFGLDEISLVAADTLVQLEKSKLDAAAWECVQQLAQAGDTPSGLLLEKDAVVEALQAQRAEARSPSRRSSGGGLDDSMSGKHAV
jgi:hypothetical protein